MLSYCPSGRASGGEARGRRQEIQQRTRDVASASRARSDGASLTPSALKKGANLSHLLQFHFAPREKPPGVLIPYLRFA